MQQLVESHKRLLEISELYLQTIQPNSIIGLEIKEVVFEAKKIKNPQL